ncbi:MAG: arginine--tRNA ligase [Pirellulales bacterium]
MDILSELQARFRAGLSDWTSDVAPLLAMIRPAQDPRFGDYQANCAMPLAKQWGRPPREVAAELVARVRLEDLCQPAEIAGPGFINLRLRDDVLAQAVVTALRDPHLGVPRPAQPRTYVIDFSAPNVAKPMHVGHIRSTVIGDALCRLLRFRGHHVVSDNHLGDWGTQFGMVIYGYKHFVDQTAYADQPVAELSRLYRLVNTLVEYHELKADRPRRAATVAERAAQLEQLQSAPALPDPPAEKKRLAALRKAESRLADAQGELAAADSRLNAVDRQPQLAALAAAHPTIGAAVLAETAQLHAGDPENRRLWETFLPLCRQEIHRIYDRLGVTFDEELGESFYHDQLAPVVQEFIDRGLARESDGAICVFLAGSDTPMIIRKRDGAFLYATTDLATIRYRLDRWHPDAILYVVDHRQSEHFDKLFAAARLWGAGDVELTHIAFGTVLGADGKPFKTRAGDTVGLEGLLDEGVRKALAVVAENDDRKPEGPEFTAEQRLQIAQAIGIAALKYADLSQNRTSDYEFSYDKMLALDGNTAAYMQYSYARVQGIFRRGQVDVAALLEQAGSACELAAPAERALALWLARFPEALADALADYRPNLLTGYLYEVTRKFSAFFEACPVLKAEATSTRHSRLLLCALTGQIVRQGLELLGIQVVERM